MSFVPSVLVALVAFVVMEPVTAASHRWLMHGVAERLHRSHHQRPGSTRWEPNDWFPVMFASVVMVAMWAGFNRDGLGALIPVAIGVTSYGAAYALVHDGYIHGRLPGVGHHRIEILDRLAEAHRIHHLFGRAPYGMLLPVVPAELRARAARTARNPLVRV